MADSQTCPKCNASKYNNPQLRLMVNLCGHSLCENCVEVLFARGSGLCVQCKTPIRKVNFRYQLFEDPTVQKEVDIRKKVLVDFNKREEDFDTLEDYDAYLELVEDIIYKLCNDIDVDKTRKFIEQYKKDNKDIIKRNRTKLSKWAEFYESELEHERSEREARAEAQAAEEAANLNRRKRLVAATSIQGFLCGPAAVPLPETTTPVSKVEVSETTYPQLTSELPPVPQSALLVDSRYRFLPPPTSVLPSARPMAPPSAIPGRWAVSTLFAPVSGMPGVSPFAMPAVPVLGNAWGNTLDPLTAPKADKVVLSRSRASKPPVTNSLLKTEQTFTQGRTLQEWLKPYKPDVVGPQPPTEEDTDRWNKLMSVYLKTIIEPLTERPDGPSATWKNGVEEVKKGLSHALPEGTTGISPSTHLYRALEDSRCFLFNPQ
ncbi:unnamed protein product [Hymenolepis diminuta]|uniref:CDK-activating kinase assembly factor MAT1 n=1 Tax=Hymenolepis diminuta TaxID=6216 RepID=A0A564YB18_HYMDI|nr:unnamed protein product [Hymenolepis diminuta]